MEIGKKKFTRAMVGAEGLVGMISTTLSCADVFCYMGPNAGLLYYAGLSDRLSRGYYTLFKEI